MNRCPKCRALTAEGDHYCRRCGSRLDQPMQGKLGRWALLALAGLAMAVVLATWWSSPRRPAQRLAPVAEPERSDFAVAPVAPRPAAPPPQRVTAVSLPTVWVRVRDISGREIAALPAPVVRGGWVALPRQEVLGGALWEAELPDGQRVTISAGVQADGDPVGLWQLDGVGPMTPPPLAVWDGQTALSWRPLASDDVFPVTTQEDCSRLTHFDHCSDALATTGVLLQADAVVGWTFDKTPEGRFLWIGATGDSLHPTIRVSDLYRLSFADGREEGLLLATENGELTTTERLAALAAAFGREARLTPAEQGEIFAEAPARALVHQLVDTLLANGQAVAVADNFEGRLLAQMGDAELSAKVAAASLEAYGSGRTLALMEELLYWTPTDSDTAALEALYHRVALETLRELAAAAALEELQQRLGEFAERFTDSPAIDLYRVEAALMSGDPSLARELLAARTYPSELQDRAVALAARIDEAASLEEGILIPFTPGAAAIETEARLNGMLSQRFLVDTGATTTTIPTATADRLGLSSGNARRIRVSTAGGVVTAWQARLDSILLEDATVADLTVLVLDIPDQPNLGLLGMNFIRNFEMDIDNRKGQLVLRPR